jgi:hypothetical protein
VDTKPHFLPFFLQSCHHLSNGVLSLCHTQTIPYQQRRDCYRGQLQTCWKSRCRQTATCSLNRGLTILHYKKELWLWWVWYNE